MSILAPLYAVVFAIVCIGAARQDLKEGKSKILVALDLGVAACLLFGYACYHLGFRQASLATSWKVVSPMLVGWLAYVTVKDMRSLEPEPDLSETENVWVATIGAWVAILLLVPMAWYNLLLAFRT